MKIKGNTFLVSGGSSGLGAGCVRRLSEAGANVVIADINQRDGEALAAGLGETAVFALCDVTEETAVQQAVDTAVKTFGELRGAINCAGIVIGERLVGRGGPHDLDRFRKVIDVNLIGTFNMLRFAAAAMQGNEPVEDERGVLINTASIAATDGQIGQIAYAASKGGVAAMTLPAARELARFGIRVVTIAPGIFDTPMMDGLPEEARASLAQQVPFPSRLGTAAEYAGLAEHIIKNQMLNGAVIRLDGAIRMAPK
ncbi:MAG: SDR family NAD(P)-dependent oxidoreductase [Candidatus Promineifilaceae bacterium]